MLDKPHIAFHHMTTEARDHKPRCFKGITQAVFSGAPSQKGAQAAAQKSQDRLIKLQEDQAAKTADQEARLDAELSSRKSALRSRTSGRRSLFTGLETGVAANLSNTLG